MTKPEYLNPNDSSSPAEKTLAERLVKIDRQLALADEIDNPIERFFKRDRLLELQDELQADIDDHGSQ